MRPQFKTIRQTAAMGIISEHYLREMVRKGECPHIMSGNRVLVNVTALIEILENMSKESVIQNYGSFKERKEE